MNLDQWQDKYEPIPNKYRPDMGFDLGYGCVLMRYPDLQKALKEHDLTDNHIWTIIESDTNDDLYIAHGYHIVNALGWITTLSAPHTPLHDDILVD